MLSMFLCITGQIYTYATYLIKVCNINNLHSVFRQKVLSHPKCTAAVRQTCFSKDGRYVSLVLLQLRVNYSTTELIFFDVPQDIFSLFTLN